MKKEHTWQGTFKEDLFLSPPVQGHINRKVHRIAKGHYEVSGLPRVRKLNDWLTGWQENNES